MINSSDIYGVVSNIKPFDALEQKHIDDTLVWIKSGMPLFRAVDPDSLNKHLVSYCVLFDEKALKILFGDHKKSQLWLPPGGHVEIDEFPIEAARRECFEELKIQADFWCEQPIFLTSTLTVSANAMHTDVAFWYVVKGDHREKYNFDTEEFNAIRWFDFNEIPYEKTDQNMQRFINKLGSMLE
ncbi:MAG TPA: NUDIX hydrolase [Coxiellaceae bacterium]|nr:NUDIX hydrolase [Coxiellaceae bacterium]HBY55827.1 NUDIX hydrolase [Coxiellaceae bacterium]